MGIRKGAKLTFREQGFVQDVVVGKSVKDAVRKNYNCSPRNESIVGTAVLKRPRVQQALMDIMDKTGVSDPRLVERLKYMIFDAKKEILDKEGTVHQVADNTSSLKAMDMAFKIKGAYAPERHEVLGVNVSIYQDLTDEELDRRLQLIEAREASFNQGARAQTGS